MRADHAKLEHEVDFTETARKFGARIRGEPEKGDTLEPTFHKNVPLQELYEIMERTLVSTIHGRNSAIIQS